MLSDCRPLVLCTCFITLGRVGPLAAKTSSMSEIGLNRSVFDSDLLRDQWGWERKKDNIGSSYTALVPCIVRNWVPTQTLRKLTYFTIINEDPRAVIVDTIPPAMLDGRLRSWSGTAFVLPLSLISQQSERAFQLAGSEEEWWGNEDGSCVNTLEFYVIFQASLVSYKSESPPFHPLWTWLNDNFKYIR